MSLIEDVASALHENWRKTRLREDGTFEPRWKPTKDSDFDKKYEGVESLPSHLRRTADGKLEIDIANACFSQLSAAWQEENRAAAEVAVKLVEREKSEGKKIPWLEIGNVIHDAWLERNSSAKDGELGVPFVDLPQNEKDKDIDQFLVAYDMMTARLVPMSEFWLGDIYKAQKFFDRYKHQNAKMEFNGKMIYSQYDNPQTAFVKVMGMSREEHKAALDKVVEETSSLMKKHKGDGEGRQ